MTTAFGSVHQLVCAETAAIMAPREKNLNILKLDVTLDEKRDGKADMHFVSNVRVLAHAALLAIAHRKFKEA